jgi:hypothetical protein
VRRNPDFFPRFSQQHSIEPGNLWAWTLDGIRAHVEVGITAISPGQLGGLYKTTP